MKTIKVIEWEATLPNGEKTIENTLIVLNSLLSMKKPEDMPKGLDNFRLYNRLAKAFEDAEKTKELKLEDGDYSFLKKTIENEIPSNWGMNKNIMEAMNLFLNA